MPCDVRVSILRFGARLCAQHQSQQLRPAAYAQVVGGAGAAAGLCHSRAPIAGRAPDAIREKPRNSEIGASMFEESQPARQNEHADHSDGTTDERTFAWALAFDIAREGNDHERREGDDGQHHAGAALR